MIQNKLYKLQVWFQEKKLLIRVYFTSQRKRRLICKMGEIYFAKLGVNIGAELDKHRPVLVFQGYDYFLRNSDLVFIFPLTTNAKPGKFKVFFNQNNIVKGNIKEGAILIYQGRAISKTRLVRKLGELSKEKLKEVQKQFELLLYKNTPLQPKL